MREQFSRTELLLGSGAMQKLNDSRVAIFGLGGVGGYTAEALVRSGVGNIDIIDGDKISVSNINRQIYALNSTVGMYKTEAAKTRMLDINTYCKIRDFNTFYTCENSNQFDFSEYDYVVDAIDMVSSKIELIVNAEKVKVPIISSMGTGNKLDPTAFEIADIYSTSVCPLARIMRHELRKRNIKNLKVVYSKEVPVSVAVNECDANKSERIQMASKHRIPGSNAFVPSVAGLIIAGEVVKDLIS